MTYTAHVAAMRVALFMANEEPDKAAMSLTTFHNVIAVSRVGDHHKAAGTFVPVGGAVAETRNPQKDYGGVDGVLGLGVILAEYDPKAQRVYPLNAVGERDQRTNPWEVGRNISLQCDPLRKATGFVVRGNQTGDRGFDEHVFFAGNVSGTPVILHHDTPNAPDNSTIAYEGDLSRPAKLSDALRIGAGVDTICPVGTTSSIQTKPIDWVYLNATKHGGNRYSGFLAMRFTGKDALASFETGGMIRPASDLHNLVWTDDNRWLTRAALSIANTLWTNGNPEFDAPLWIEEVNEPEVIEPNGHPVRCHIQFDPKDTHAHPCRPGTRPKMIKVHVKQTIPELPPCEGSMQTVDAKDAPSAYYAGKMIQGGLTFVSHPRA